MIGGRVVFWPAETSWDEETREVVFGGDFHSAPNAPIASTFTGGGGLFETEDDMSRILNREAETALRECLDTTGATHALLAYPETP